MDETIPVRFVRQATTFGDRPLFLTKRTGTYQPVSWRQALADVETCARFLLLRGLRPTDRILILSENRMEWGIADLAIQSIGAWSVPVYPNLTEEGLEPICQDCQPAVCVASTPEQVAKLVRISQRVSSIRSIIAMETNVATHPLVSHWSEALAAGQQALEQQSILEQRRQQLKPEETATLIYTSGTTGEPKGVMLSHQNFLSNVEACLQVIPVTRDDVHLSFLPLCHVFERMAGWYLMLTVGAQVAYAETMDTIPQNMLEVRPTVMLGVPRFFEKLYARIQEGLQQAPTMKRHLAAWAIRLGRQVATAQTSGRPIPLTLQLQYQLAQRLVYHKFHQRLGGRLRFFVSGSAPLSKEIAEFFYSVGVVILEGYGLTETSPVIAVNRLPLPTFGSVGKVLPGVEVRIAEDGEILTRGPQVMQGYYRKPEATASVIVEGWFHTGDIGHLDAEGYLYVTDRKKDLIKTAGGKFVAPQKLENLFVTDPYVSQAFVYGDRQPYCVALIVPQAERLQRYAKEQGIATTSMGDLVHDERIRTFYWQRIQQRQAGLASYEQVKKIALLDQEFSLASGELTPTLKAKRSVIAQRYDAALKQLYQQSSP